MYNPNSINTLFTLDKCFHRALKNGHVFRYAEIEAVTKVLSCKTHKLGARKYSCSNKNCSHKKHVFNTCKSKLCTSCGQKATERWIATQNEILPDCKYRHITFTMPEQFWDIFKYNRALLNHLFSLAAGTLLNIATKKSLIIGIFAALHTYGRQLNFNCHIHLSLAEYALNKQGDLKIFSFKFSELMKQWRYSVIHLLRTFYPVIILPPELAKEGYSPQSWNSFLNKHYNTHWNVDIAKTTNHKSHTAKYLGSYVKKPPIAAARLADYAGGDVTFNYLDHNSKKYKDLTLDQTEMMLRVLSHVPEKHFKMIRYFGFLSNRLRGSLLPLIYEKLEQNISPIKTFGFATMMKAFLKVDPFKCILCGARMVYTGFIVGLKIGQLVSAIENIVLQRPI
ncbi:IS91 family transposase ISVsa21 [Photobacterium phosphoreum]|jgi:hypothetical protein|uniref:IS91 family transposase n=1 Tax=Photobacterium phosphoreum TaxID=659 RepID=UPI000D1657B6|nr:IS91 family transposase [Photobacterium phosphoreum]PSW27703.1 IS91 family transposase ISVsa21 [Photobacterium phosphoreum]